MLDKLKQLFNKIVFHIKCSLSSSCCVDQKEKEMEKDVANNMYKQAVIDDVLKQVENQNIYLQTKDIDK